MPEPQWSPYEYPELDVKEYNNKLEALLWRRFYANQLDDEKGKRLKPENKNDLVKATNYINNMVRQTISEGVNPRLPFFNEVITATMTPEWYQGQVGQYMGDWAQWGEEQARTKERDWQREFGVQQWQQSEAWRRYGAEAQQQRWQAEQDAQRQQQWWSLQRQREATREAKYGWGQQRLAHQLGTGGGDIREAQQAGMAQQWQTWQNRLASGATWPQSEIFRTQRNPYEVTPESIGDELQAVKGEYEFAKEKADWFRKRQKDPEDPLTAGRAEYFDIMGESDIEERWSPDQQAAYGAYLAEAVAGRQYEQLLGSREGQDWAGWKAGQEKGRATSRAAGWGAEYGRDLPPKLPPPMPKTPAFLRKAYPELGERLPRDKEQAPMYPLSGQQWGQMLPSQRSKWAGYIGWAGGKPEDLYAQMQAMTPRYRPGVRWQAARQGA